MSWVVQVRYSKPYRKHSRLAADRLRAKSRCSLGPIHFAAATLTAQGGSTEQAHESAGPTSIQPNRKPLQDDKHTLVAVTAATKKNQSW